MELQPPRTVDEVATIRSVRGGQASPVRARGAKAPQEVGGAREEVCRLGGNGVGCRFEKPEDGGAGNTSEPGGRPGGRGPVEEPRPAEVVSAERAEEFAKLER